MTKANIRLRASVLALCVATNGMSFPAFAASIYGLNIPVAGTVDFGQIDPTTGAFSQIATMPGGTILSTGVKPENPIIGEYYFSAGGSGTLAVLQSGTNRTLATTVPLLGFDTSKNRLVGMTTDGTGNHLTLIDPASGAQTVLTTSFAPFSQSFVSGAAAINTVGREAYILASGNTLLTVDADTGALIRSVSLSRSITGGLVWNGVTGTLYDLSTVSAGDHRLVSVDPATGAVTIISPSSVASSLTSNERAIAIRDGVLYVATSSSSYNAIDLKTGLLKSTIPSSASAFFPQGGLIIGGDTVFSQTITNAAETLYKAGAGTTVLSGQNLHTGGTQILSGALSISSDANLGVGGVVAISDGAGLNITQSGSYGHAVTLSGVGSVTVSAGQTAVWSATISDGSSPGTLNVNGPGTLSLTGANTYSGGTIVNGGVLQLGLLSGSLANSGALTVNGGTFDLNGRVQTVGALSGTGGTISFGSALHSGSLTTNSNTDTTLASIITGDGSLTKAGTGTLVLTGVNTFRGSLIVSGGVLRLGAGGSIANVSTFSIAGGSTLDLNGHDQTIVGVNGNGNLALGSAMLTLSGGTFFGVISGSGGITANDPRRFPSFSGINTYTGATTIDSTHLSLFGQGSIASSSGVNILNGGTFSIASTNAGAMIKSLSGLGFVDLGNKTLTLTNAFGTFSGPIQGTGRLQITGGTQILIGTSSTYTGGTIISGGTLQIGNGGTTGLITGNVTANGALVFNRSDTFSFGGEISGTGSLSQAGSGTLILTGESIHGGGTTIANGTLQIGNGGTTGSISGNIVNNGALIFNRAGSVSLDGATSGTGSLLQSGSGTLILTGNSSHSGGTTISNGALQIGNGGTTGSISGNIVNTTALLFNRSDASTFAGVISGTGTVTKLGAGALTLSGTNSYSGVTTVSGGTLNVTGALSNSNTSVANGGTLTGTGSVRNVTVANGGTVGPFGTGTLTVQGNLTLNAGANYADSITPSTAGLTNVSGTAGLGGTAIISAGAGAYSAGQRYTLLNASGGIGGTFSALTMLNLPGNVRGELAYDATRVYLDLKVNAITPLLPSGASPNQTSLAAGIDAGLQQGTPLNAGFTALFNLQGAALGNALNQISGQGASNIATAGGQSLTPFLSVMQGQGAFGGNGTNTAANFAPGNGYGAADGPRRAQLAPGEMRVWGSVYGGHAGISANAATGAAGLSANNVGFVAGAEVSLTDDFRLGGSAGFGSQDFSSANSVGDSDDVMLGLYARQDLLENGYIAAAFAYSWHDIATTRTITVAGTDVLGAKFDAHAIGGRIEGGWRLALDDAFGVTPFFAFAGDNFYAPAYAESAISGSSSFALSYAANKTAQKHTEFGAHLDHAIDLGGGDMLSADARAAWAHQLDDAAFVTATFQGLPGSSFRLLGVRAATDTALLGLGLKIRNPSGLDVGLRMDSQLGAGTTVLQGMGTVSWRW